ncbi:terminus macrodomain insulation protein YfbV [Salinivibrio sp. IB872]|jgi:uncharacterized membrane protein YfbV (UPF0208 family)|uniref:terminus macrodomain insulation protein YfbV n=1 Tax=Salinivibrio sp. IB872 TaxID=1766123 RepID=UPI0009872DA0|nr:terminus macrodomain insulation protein YfbV [Salinivibrio sp. IB872]OOF26950.1 hypothetical protein BZJ18_08930 [Salinivibrio sp. IB872]
MATNKSIWRCLQDGQKYMKEWPMRKELTPVFPENRVIKTTRFAMKVMPAVAAVSVLLQMATYNYQGMPQAMIVALFALSLPLQGLWWLGKRRDTPLPPALAGWYRELHQKITSQGHAMQPLKSQPRYKELAQALSRAFKVDRAALERWF